MNQTQNWLCAQLGAREHYAIPRALHAAGMLGGLMTDFWADPITRTLARYSPIKSIRSLSSRFHPDISREHVKSWNLRAIGWEAHLRRRMWRGGATNRYLGYCEVGKRFAEAVLRCMKTMRKIPDNAVFFGYDTCSLEIMEQLKERGITCVLDQIDPCRVEIETVQAEQDTWPDWDNERLDIPDEFYERHIREWDIADRILVNSEFCSQALVAQGVPREKIAVIALSFERESWHNGETRETARRPEMQRERCFSRDQPLRVLFLGQVMLRKGIQYLAQAAELLVDYPVIFDVVGPIHISEKAVSSVPANVVFHGRITRFETGKWYRRADVFVLPTLSDGFAITQIEAMAHGLPVVATPNCGAVVADSINGFLMPPRDPVALAHAIRRYLKDPDCLDRQRRAALERSKEFSLERLGGALQNLFRESV